MFKKQGVTVRMVDRFITMFHQLQRLFVLEKHGRMFAFRDLERV
jgi:hypothetical protein